MNQFLQEALQLSDEIIGHRHFFHQTAEVGLHLPKTKVHILAALREMGYEPQELGDSGITATIGHGGKTFLLRADTDALPIPEETGLPFAAQNGNMHACGHDCHASMLLGAAKLLKAHEAELSGTVKLLFQPAEEILEGAKAMIEAGCLKNPDVDAAMMIHVITNVPSSTGVCAVFGGGPSYASADWFRIDVQGKGGHGATPDMAVNPLPCLAQIVGAAQEIISDRIPASTSATMTICELHGGTVSNIIPDTGYLTGTIRTFDETVRASIKEKLIRAAEHIALSKDCTATVSFSYFSPTCVCDEQTSLEVMEYNKKLLGEPWVLNLKTAFGGAFATATGSEDFAYLAKEVPSAVVWFLIGSTADGYTHSGHHPKADFAETELFKGAAIYAHTAMEWLSAHH